MYTLYNTVVGIPRRQNHIIKITFCYQGLCQLLKANLKRKALILSELIIFNQETMMGLTFFCHISIQVRLIAMNFI